MDIWTRLLFYTKFNWIFGPSLLEITSPLVIKFYRRRIFFDENQACLKSKAPTKKIMVVCKDS